MAQSMDGRRSSYSFHTVAGTAKPHLRTGRDDDSASDRRASRISGAHRRFDHSARLSASRADSSKRSCHTNTSSPSGTDISDTPPHRGGSYARFVGDRSFSVEDRDKYMAEAVCHTVEADIRPFSRNCRQFPRRWPPGRYCRRPCDTIRDMCAGRT